MDITSPLLGQLLFELTVAFFYAFTGLAVGLAGYLAISFGLKSRVLSPFDSNIFRVWLRVFALTLFAAMALGLMALIEIGMIWPTLVAKIGHVLGPLIFSGVVVFVVIKSTVLDVLLFGRQRASESQYRWALWSVVLGLMVLQYCVVAFDAWTRLPAGAMLIDDRYRIYDWFSLLTQSSVWIQFISFVLTAFYSAAALMLGLSTLHVQGKAALFEPAHAHVLKTVLIIGLGALVAQVMLIGLLDQGGVLPFNIDFTQGSWMMWTVSAALLAMVMVGGLCAMVYPWKSRLLSYCLMSSIGLSFLIGMAAWFVLNQSRSEFAAVNASNAAQFISHAPMAWLAGSLGVVVIFLMLLMVSFVYLSRSAITQGVVPVVKVSA